VEFGRVLLIYADLVVNGKPPDEGDWVAYAKGQQSTPSEFTCSPIPCEKPLP